MSGQEAEQQRAFEEAQTGQQPYAPYNQPQPGGPDPFYPQPNSAPPPINPGYNASPGYNNPADYPPPTAPQPSGQIHSDYGYQPQQAYPPPAGGPYTPAQMDLYDPPSNGVRRGDEKGSAQPIFNNTFGALAMGHSAHLIMIAAVTNKILPLRPPLTTSHPINNNNTIIIIAVECLKMTRCGLFPPPHPTPPLTYPPVLTNTADANPIRARIRGQTRWRIC